MQKEILLTERFFFSQRKNNKLWENVVNVFSVGNNNQAQGF